MAFVSWSRRAMTAISLSGLGGGTNTGGGGGKDGGGPAAGGGACFAVARGVGSSRGLVSIAERACGGRAAAAEAADESIEAATAEPLRATAELLGPRRDESDAREATRAGEAEAAAL